MRVYWHSTAPFGPSSYSVLTKRTVPEIVRLGHECVVGTWYGLQGEPQRWPIRDRNVKNGNPIGVVTVLPSMDPNAYGTDMFLANYQACKADVAITCMDVWVMPPALTSQTRFAPWIPIDHDPPPMAVINSLQPSVYTMCYSQWGTDLLKAHNVQAHYVPCSADVDQFYPTPMDEARKALPVPADTKFLATMIAANKDPSDRKGFAEAVQGFAKRFKGVEGAYLYIHTNWRGPINIPALIERCGVSKQTLCPNQYQMMIGQFTDDYMRMAYSASDVLLNPAKSEGFGLPILEAQLCGCPVIVTDFSSMPELVTSGWKVPGIPHWSMGAEAWRRLADTDAIAAALDDAWNRRGDRAFREQARLGSLDYDNAKVAEKYWKPALTAISEIAAGTAGELELVKF